MKKKNKHRARRARLERKLTRSQMFAFADNRRGIYYSILEKKKIKKKNFAYGVRNWVLIFTNVVMM